MVIPAVLLKITRLWPRARLITNVCGQNHRIIVAACLWFRCMFCDKVTQTFSDSIFLLEEVPLWEPRASAVADAALCWALSSLWLSHTAATLHPLFPKEFFTGVCCYSQCLEAHVMVWLLFAAPLSMAACCELEDKRWKGCSGHPQCIRAQWRSW